MPGRRSHTKPVKYNRWEYKRRNRIEIMFGSLKDWRRIATCYDRYPTAFSSAIGLAAIVIFCLCGLSLISFNSAKTDAKKKHNTSF
ncbi:transposase [Gluconobacter sphaericus]|nr:transposase [Gluconobacter sphaericus]MBS1086143.1 transposase [Gluconobacter sphaericus]MBS1100108.1 transposase [Gluconobacter sphaericus]QQX92362.1 transposase [Gluconobacter sphaericus]